MNMEERENEESKNIATIHKHLMALENGLVGEALAPFFTDNVVQVEFPNSEIRNPQ